MKACLEGLLPRVIPQEMSCIVIPHEGKSDLQKSIPRKLRGWNEPNVRFVVVHDQDSASCPKLKQKLIALCEEGRRPDTLIRIACRELESWFLGDPSAVESAYGRRVAKLQESRKFRDPDSLVNPAKELNSLIPRYGKVKGAGSIGPRLSLDTNRSKSFQVFVQGVRRIVGEMMNLDSV
jgi:hypothetical protein